MSLEASLVHSIDQIARDQWDALPKGIAPFWHYDFLKVLERSRSTGFESGWTMQFLILKERAATIALLPLWRKSHSMGEYVFDQMFAESWQRYEGTAYYPKLVAAAPFTPVRLPKLMAQETTQQQALLRYAKALCCSEGLSSLHLNFLPQGEAVLAEQEGFAKRLNIQCHWHNRGYADFEEFSQSLPRSRRKTIRKERAALAQQGFRFRRLSGAELQGEEAEPLWEIFYRLYSATYARKWGYSYFTPYLTREFFRLLGQGDTQQLANNTLLVVGEKEGQVRSVALSFFDKQALYGRHWGATDYVPYLHFETCYYQSILFALERGLSRVEAGTQGVEHKMPRGFEPELLASAHFFSEKSFDEAAAQWCAHERSAIEQQHAALCSAARKKA